MPDADRIPTNLRALKCLEVVAASDRPLSPTEIGRRVGLPKQTIHRLCGTLVNEGYLEREGDGRLLTPSIAMRRIAAGLLHGQHVRIARHQILLEIAKSTGETVNFAVPTARGMIYRDRVETDWPFRIQLPIGSHVPFHATASGKVYLASLPSRQRRGLVETLPLTAETSHTFVEPAALLAELSRVRQQDYAIDNEELMTSMVAIAVPVRDANGRYIASLAFHGPYPRLTAEKAISHLEKLRESAQSLAAHLVGLDEG